MKKRVVLGMMIVMAAGFLQANINNIKDTYTILKDAFKDLSVIHGVVAWETGTIQTHV